MVTLTVELPDGLPEQLRARAAQEGYRSVEAYVAGLIREDVGGLDHGAPYHLRVGSAAVLEAKLLEGISSPAAEMTDQDWTEMRRRLIDRRAGGV